MTAAGNTDDVTYRQVRPDEGADMWRVTRDSGGLELNTQYAYILLAQHFGDTSVVAEHQGEVVGFVGAYLIPKKPDTVFVWQIGVDAKMRGRGCGKKILHALVELPGCKDVRFLETTVTPSNTASQKLFAGFAREREAPIEKLEGFGENLFKYGEHEAEDLYRIGPFRGGEA